MPPGPADEGLDDGPILHKYDVPVPEPLDDEIESFLLLDAQDDDPVEFLLFHRHDPAIGEMFSKQHGEPGGLGRILRALG